MEAGAARLREAHASGVSSSRQSRAAGSVLLYRCNRPVNDRLELMRWQPMQSQPSRSSRSLRHLLERAAADVQAIGAPATVAAAYGFVPLSFRALRFAGCLTAVCTRHGYRLAVLGADRFAGRSVLDVGAFDGFYSFLAEVRGARRVVAVDNEQYVEWVRARFGVTLTGGDGFRAIAGLVASRVEFAAWTCWSARARRALRRCVVFWDLAPSDRPDCVAEERSRTCWRRVAKSCSRPTARAWPPTPQQLSSRSGRCVRAR